MIKLRKARKDYLAPIPRFWSLVNKYGPIHPIHGQCWIWLGHNNWEYGDLRVNGLRVKAHRFSYEINIAPITEDICVLHKCDTPLCVNPAHLFLGDKKANSDDMKAKGREVKIGGIEHHNAKLDDDKVREIRRKYSTKSYRCKDLAREFNVSTVTINNIIWGLIWKHVKQEIN